ncbi:MAG: type IV pilus biogenesis/stability protein PilW [Bermanella sp.]
MPIKIIRIAAAIAVTLLLSACVSITETRYSKNANPEKAAETYVALAVGYLSQGNMILARQKLDRALLLDPENPAVHSAFAMYWLERGEIKLTEQAFATALDLDAQHSPTNYHYGVYLMRYKKDKTACDYMAMAAQDVDYSARVLANENLGLCLVNGGNSAAAISAFEKAWILDSHSTVSSMNLTAIYLQRKRVRLASRWFKRFEQTLTDGKVPHSAASLSLAVQLARVQGDQNAVHSYGFKLKKHFPSSAEYKSYLSSH